MADDTSAIPSSSMISADNVIVTGGQFTQTLNDNRQFRIQNGNKKDPLDILKEAVASNAFHNAEARFNPPRCHPRTRIAVLAKIMDWILGQDSETRDILIMWLTGAAGAGKSSIAQSIIERCLKKSDTLVLASFFFNRSDSTRNHAKPLVATLAYQIYRALPALQSQISYVLDDDPLIFSKNLEYQFTTLIMKPLQDLHNSGQLTRSESRRLIVVDGLDECIIRASQATILNMISDGVRNFKLPVFFLIASRPEHDIRQTFNSEEMVGVHDCILLDDKYKPDKDIRIFLNDNFRRIREQHPFKGSIPGGWPGNQVVSALVAKSSGQFIYAATVIKFIDSSRHQPGHRLEIVLKLRVAKNESPFEQLDALYRHILSCVDPEVIGKVLRVFGLVFVWPKIRSQNMLDLRINQFMPLDDGELSVILCDLGALVQVNDPMCISSVKVWHASLEDFFCDPLRSKEFYIDTKDTFTAMAVRCLQRIPSLPEHSMWREAMISFFIWEARNFKLSTELALEVERFPIRESLFVISSNGSFSISQQNLDFLSTFLHLSKRMADDGSTRIHDRSLQIMDHIFFSSVANYSVYGVLSLILCLSVHAGSHPLVPFVSKGDFSTLAPWYEKLGRDAFSQHHPYCQDPLSLSTERSGMPDAYMQIFRDFMRDPTRAGPYCIGTEAYELATLFCMQMLAYNERHRQLDVEFVMQKVYLMDLTLAGKMFFKTDAVASATPSVAHLDSGYCNVGTSGIGI